MDIRSRPLPAYLQNNKNQFVTQSSEDKEKLTSILFDLNLSESIPLKDYFDNEERTEAQAHDRFVKYKIASLQNPYGHTSVSNSSYYDCDPAPSTDSKEYELSNVMDQLNDLTLEERKPKKQEEHKQEKTENLIDSKRVKEEVKVESDDSDWEDIEEAIKPDAINDKEESNDSDWSDDGTPVRKPKVPITIPFKPANLKPLQPIPEKIEKKKKPIQLPPIQYSKIQPNSVQIQPSIIKEEPNSQDEQIHAKFQSAQKFVAPDAEDQKKKTLSLKHRRTDKNKIVSINVPDKGKMTQQDFTFKLDTNGQDYIFQFGNTPLCLWEYSRHAGYMRRNKPFRNQDQQNAIIDSDKTTATNQKFKASEKWTEVNQYPRLTELFPVPNPEESKIQESKQLTNCNYIILNEVLLRFLPRQDDVPGHVYILQRDKDVLKLNQGKITHILLHKIGLSTRIDRRIKDQERANSETYNILASYYTKYVKYFEWAMHRMYQDQRVRKLDSKDGYTEWFLISEQEVLASTKKVWESLSILFADNIGFTNQKNDEEQNQQS